MAAVILPWQPAGRNRWNYRAAVEHIAGSGRFFQQWALDRELPLTAGTEAWLFVQGSAGWGTGLTGHGTVMSGLNRSFVREHPVSGKRDDMAWEITVAFDALLPLGEHIRADVLSIAVPGIPWDGILDSPGMAVPLAAEPHLRQLWREQGPTPASPGRLVPGTFPLDAISSIDVLRYEYDPDARRVCLAFHGTSCAACGFSFETFFGGEGAGCIEVHHVTPPSMLGGTYQLDPVADLVPLCPNCHAVAHRRDGGQQTVTELRSLISGAGHLHGEVVSERALAAQKDARRILDERHD